MNLAETFRGLVRRWYVVVPGIILALAGALATFSVTTPDYERTATQILLPGPGTLPKDATNPYLYLGGLPSAADVLVRAVGSEDSLRDLLQQYPGSEVEVTRDPTTSGPVIMIKVTAPSDAAAADIIDQLVQRTASTLADLQNAQSVRANDAITVTPISVDRESTLQQRNRIVLSGGVAAGGILLALLIGSAVDGLVTRSRRTGRSTPDTDGVDGAADDLASADLIDVPDEAPSPARDSAAAQPGRSRRSGADAAPDTSIVVEDAAPEEVAVLAEDAVDDVSPEADDVAEDAPAAAEPAPAAEAAADERVGQRRGPRPSARPKARPVGARRR